MRILPTRPKLAWTRIRYEDTGSASPNRGENIFVDRRASNQSHDAEAFAETGPRRRISIMPFLICHGSGCATLIASNRFPGLAPGAPILRPLLGSEPDYSQQKSGILKRRPFG